jgi:hypothetical protein
MRKTQLESTIATVERLLQLMIGDCSVQPTLRDMKRRKHKIAPHDGGPEPSIDRGAAREAEKNKVIASGNAQAVFNRLREIEQSRTANLSRWAWELLQNARDAAGNCHHVSVRLAFDGTALTFTHDGPPFRDDEIAHLIFHGSTKQDHPGIGRFGTGFISTHLLSRVVRVKGPLEDGTAFDFALDRTGHDAKALQASMERSWVAMTASIRPQKQVDVDRRTAFTYTIEPETQQHVVEGLNELRRTAPLILAFNPQFSSLSIDASGDLVTYSVCSRQTKAKDVHEMRIVDGSGSEVGMVTVAERGDVQAAIAVTPALRSGSILPEPRMSRMYVAFPLLKTDTFPLRTAMNSEGFHPRTERDGIYLLGEDSEQNVQNRERFERGCEAFSDLIEHAVHSPIVSVPELLILSAPGNLESVDGVWLKETIATRVVSKLRARNVFRTSDGALAELRSGIIPFGEADIRHALWSLIARIKALAPRLPAHEELDTWNGVVASWIEFTDSPTDGFDETWTLERLSAWAASVETTAMLAEKIEGDVWEWLSDLYDVLRLDDKLDLVDERAIVPSQSGIFLKTCDLLRDGGLQDDLKDIAEGAGLPGRDGLLAKELSECCLASRLGEQTAEDLIQAIIGQIGYVDAGQAQSAVRLFGFLVRNRLENWLETIPVLTAKEPLEATTISLDAPATQRLLVPVARWGGGTNFANLFPAELVMHDDYTTILADENWECLIDQGAAIASPLVTHSEVVDDFVTMTEGQEDEPRSKYEISRSYIAHFSSVFERVRDSRQRGALLVRFLLEFVVPNDADAFTELEVECEDGERWTCYRAAWIAPLRSHAWIMRPDKRRVHLAPRSLADLLSEQPNIIQLLLDDKYAPLLKSLDLSASELALQTVGKTDRDRMSLIRSLGVIADAIGSDPVRVARFANTIRSDKTVLQYVEQRSAFIERIERNQRFGFAVEREFNAVFEGEQGVRITRTGHGHDFVVGEEDDAGKVEVMSVKREIFIELKATRELDAVYMSVRQVQAAIEPDSYWLCVVVSQAANPTGDHVRTNAKFVCDIGSRLGKTWSEYEGLRDATPELPDAEGETALEVSGQEVRFRVAHKLWGNGISFENAIKQLRRQLRATPRRKRS